MNRRRDDEVSWDPNDTGEFERRAEGRNYDDINRFQWEAIRNNTTGVKESIAALSKLSERIAVLESNNRNLKWLVGFLLALIGLVEGKHL